MKMSRSNIIIIVLFCSIQGIGSMHAISRKASYALSGLVAGACTAIEYKALKGQLIDIHPVLLAAVNIAVTSATYVYTSFLTPEGAIASIKKDIKKLYRYQLIKYADANDTNFFNAIHNAYLKVDLPLIGAYHDLLSLIPVVESVKKRLNTNLLQITYNEELKEEYIFYLKHIKKISCAVCRAIQRVRDHKDYLQQLHIYKNFLHQNGYFSSIDEKCSGFLWISWFFKKKQLYIPL